MFQHHYCERHQYHEDADPEHEIFERSPALEEEKHYRYHNPGKHPHQQQIIPNVQLFGGG